MELRNLQSFLRVAELGNFTKAANDLGYSQAAITVHIKQLEEELGVSLFDRLGNNISLTPVGVKLVEYANQIQQIHTNIGNLVLSDPQKLQGTLRLGSVESVSSSILVPAITEFRTKYPLVNIDIQIGYRKKLFEALKKNETDLIFTIGTKDAPAYSIEIFHLLEETSFFACPGHPLTNHPIKAAELFDYPFILTGIDSFLERELFHLADSRSKTIASFIRSSNTTTIIELVQNNLGISFLGISNLKPYIANHSLVPLSVNDYSFFYYISAYRNRSKWISPQMDGFIKILSKYI